MNNIILSSDNLYKGKLVKIINGEKVTLKEENLVYDEEANNFLLDSAFWYYFSLCLEREKLTDKQIEEYEKIVEENTFICKDTGKENEIFIDKDSLEIVLHGKKNRR